MRTESIRKFPLIARALCMAVLCAISTARASGPIAPSGWNGAQGETLPNGQPCCYPADLQGNGLIGGAFVLVKDDKTEFSLFALTYDATNKQTWQMLERYPISKLKTFRVGIESPKQTPFSAIKACDGAEHCSRHYLQSKGSKFTKVVLK
jgi:hypothetical protein